MSVPPMEDQEIADAAVTAADLAVWDAEFNRLCGRVEGLFYRPEPRRHAEQYLRGLLAPLERKNGWTISEFVGEPEPKALQRFLNLTPWDADELRDVVVGYVMEHFADPQGVLIADPTAFPKKGTMSAGVQRQYSGTLGKVDNCQIGTFLAYVNTVGDRVLVDRELYLPKKSWLDRRDRCRQAGIPDQVTFATRPQQVQMMIDRARQAGLPFAWFVADEEFGQNPGLASHLETAGIPYVMAIPKDTACTVAAGVLAAIEDHASKLRPNEWQRRACGIGAKGFRVYDWALLDSAHPDFGYLIRRSLQDGDLAYYRCHNPTRAGFGELVRVAGSRWPIEECFGTAKSQAGLDNYQVRLFHAWYRHITLSMLVLAFLAVMARTAKKGIHRLWTTKST